MRDGDEALDGSFSVAEGLGGCRVGWWWCSCTRGVSVVRECDEDEEEDKEGNGASMVVVCGVGCRPSFVVVLVVFLVTRV